MRDKYHKNIAKGSAIIKPKREDGWQIFILDCSNTRMFARADPNDKRIIATGKPMTARLANIQISDSNDKTDKKTNMSSSEDETLDYIYSSLLCRVGSHMGPY